MNRNRERVAGFTLVEVLVTVVILALILVGIAGVMEQALRAESATRERNDLTREARFALDRMATAVSATRRLLVPMAENPGTAWSESIRDPGVLAVTLDPLLDRDGDGFADGDNDKDGAIDEDLSGDWTKDGASGVIGLDDDGDGQTDEGAADDDDEDGLVNEDPVDGIDNDGDGAVDEDSIADMNNDGKPGIALVDDDLDGTVDEGNKNDDDEDGSINEEWLDVVAYFLSGTTLMERLPDLNASSGTDFSERVIAENVASFRVERIPKGAGRAVLVDITLGLAGQHAKVELHTRVRLGAGP